MQAIQTKYLPATNNRGSRIKATCDRGSITIPYPHDLSGDEIHRAAVRALVEKFIMADELEYGTPHSENSWNRPYLSGGLPDGSMVHVQPAVGSNAVLIQCADESDASYIERYIEAARTAGGTVTGALHGCACSAMKHSAKTILS